MSQLNETETHDTLPFVVDTMGNNKSEKDKVIAPSIDEVDNDVETLRTIRGEGRYFGLLDENGNALSDSINELQPKCNNCSQRGHLKKNCPHVICTYCGAMDDHYSKHCNKAIKCANCNENGHYRSQCPHKWKKIYCSICNSNRHNRDRCPQIWRAYLLKDNDSKTAQQNGNIDNEIKLNMDLIYCYNCGVQGHFGDDCYERRSSRVPNDDGSAFSGENLPQSLKDEYFDILNGTNTRNISMSKRKNNHNSLYDDYANSNNDFDYNDYELDDIYYENNNNNSNNRQNHGSRQNSNRKRKRNENSYNNKNNSNNSNHNSKKSDNNPQPMRKGITLNKNSNNNNNSSRNSNNYNSRNSHPLDFPRSNRNNYGNYNNNTFNNYNNNYNNNSNYNNNNNSNNYKNYNQYKPFRSGTIRR